MGLKTLIHVALVSRLEAMRLVTEKANAEGAHTNLHRVVNLETLATNRWRRLALKQVPDDTVQFTCRELGILNGIKLSSGLENALNGEPG